ncbi:MAG: sigma-70 family RNA polymerase sigma factor [Planctomycetes bacterium]|nr:sigma-70 family RNA polymerase sigma factor [Planctomycetota bacterium]
MFLGSESDSSSGARDGARDDDRRDDALDTQGLARAAKAGEAERFGELYERIAPALYAWAALRIRPGMRGAVDPQDVVQEVWCRAWKAFPAFDPNEQSFRLWVFRIGKNVMLEAFRKLQRSGPTAGNAGTSTRAFQLANVPDTATAVSRRVAKHEGLQKMIDWIAALDEEEKKLVVFCGLEGLSYSEVGERTQTHKDTIAKRWQTLRARLAQFGAPKELLAGE